jgi:ABC-type uncharacterized transport system substrate-binding protein
MNRRLLLRAASLAFALPLPLRSAAPEADVRAILADDSDAQRRILDALRSRFSRLSASSDIGELTRRSGRGVHLAIGPAALQAALAVRLPGPLISAFTSRQTYSRLLAESGRSAGTGVTAIYAEPSAAQQMQLIAALYGRRVTVGALYSPQSAYMEPLLRQAAREHGIDVELQLVAPQSNLTRALTGLQSATVLLIFPDAELYTPQSLRQLIESSYRRRLPVIGFSAALVAAGTLASAYTDIDDTVAHLLSVVEAVAAGRLPEPQYPRYWRVAINDSVARSLNVVVDDAVRRLGDRPP